MTKLKFAETNIGAELIENPTLRSQHINKIDVLERVGSLILLPNSTIATTQMVADFYRVDQQALYSLVHDHKAELQSDGYRTISSKDLVARLIALPSEEVVSIERSKGGYLINDDYKISYSKVGVFTKRAILRVGMVLRDSLVAREVREMILNNYENQVVINGEEDKLLLDIIKADGLMDMAIAVNAYKKHKDNQIETLQEITENQNERYNLVMEKLGEIVALTQLNQLPHKV